MANSHPVPSDRDATVPLTRHHRVEGKELRKREEGLKALTVSSSHTVADTAGTRPLVLAVPATEVTRGAHLAGQMGPIHAAGISRKISSGSPTPTQPSTWRPGFSKFQLVKYPASGLPFLPLFCLRPLLSLNPQSSFPLYHRKPAPSTARAQMSYVQQHWGSPRLNATSGGFLMRTKGRSRRIENR